MLHLGFLDRSAGARRLVPRALAAGALLETANLHLGVTAFRDLPLGLPLAPAWMAILWGAFAASARPTLGWLAGRPAAAALLGALLGPLSFAAGERLGALTLGGSPALAVLAAEWAAAMAILAGPGAGARRTPSSPGRAGGTGPAPPPPTASAAASAGASAPGRGRAPAT